MGTAVASSNPEIPPSDDRPDQERLEQADRRDTVEQMAKWALLAPLMTVLFDPERAAAGAESAVF
jgi:hypothetical protein